MRTNLTRRSMGDFNITALLALGIDKIEVITNATGSIMIDLAAPPGAGSALARKLQPAVILSGNLGRYQIAPYGMPSGVSPEVRTALWSVGIGLGAAVVGVALFGGALFGRRS